MESISKKRQQFSIKNGFNDLDFSFFRLNEFSINLLFLLITQIDSKNDEELFTYRMTIKELEEIFDKKRINKLTIHKAREELFEQTIQISLKEEPLIEISIFSVFIIDGNLLQLKLNDAFQRFFLEINSKTPYFKGYMSEFLALKNINAKHLYLLLRQLLNRRYNKQYTVKDLRTKLGFSENEYVKFKDFNRKVLKNSIESINQFTSLNAEIIYVRHSRDVERVEFKISETKKTRAVNNSKISTIERMVNWANETVDDDDKLKDSALKWVQEGNDDTIVDVEVLTPKKK